ncbi:hypothetical protein Tco_1510625, partial [Tanacetum coccineum]
MKNTPDEFTDDEVSSLEIEKVNKPSQNIEEIISILQEARKGVIDDKQDGQFVGGGSMDLDDDIDTDDEFEDDVDSSEDFVCAIYVTNRKCELINDTTLADSIGIVDPLQACAGSCGERFSLA